MPGGKNASLSSSLKLVNVLYGKVSQQISTFSMQRSTVNMIIAQLTASLSAHKPRNTSPKDHTGGSNPFVDTNAPLTTVELEVNGNGDMVQGLSCSPPKGPERQGPSSNLTPRPTRADYPFQGLKMLTPPPTDQQLVYIFFYSELETNDTGQLDFTNNSGVQDPLLQAYESNQNKMPVGCSPYGKGYQGLVRKGNRPGSKATGQPVHFKTKVAIIDLSSTFVL